MESLQLEDSNNIAFPLFSFNHPFCFRMCSAILLSCYKSFLCIQDGSQFGLGSSGPNSTPEGQRLILETPFLVLCLHTLSFLCGICCVFVVESQNMTQPRVFSSPLGINNAHGLARCIAFWETTGPQRLRERSQVATECVNVVLLHEGYVPAPCQIPRSTSRLSPGRAFKGHYHSLQRHHRGCVQI